MGLCHMDVVEVGDVLSVGPELGGNVASTVVLKEGKSWSRVYLDDDGGLFTDKWVTQDGLQHSAAEISGMVAKDRLALMPKLWAMKGKRYLVLFYTRNGDQLLMGRPETPAIAQVHERTSGQEIQRDRNGMGISFSLATRRPVPFYGGTPPPPPSPPGECPSLCAMMDAAFVGAEQEAGLDVVLDGEAGFIPQVGEVNGKPAYSMPGFGGGAEAEAFWHAGEWHLQWGDLAWTSDEDVATPGLVTTWTGSPTPTVVDVAATELDASALADCWNEAQKAAVLQELGGGGPCADVTIEDQDENPIASVPSGGTYQVIVVSGINGGNASTVFTNSIIQA